MSCGGFGVMGEAFIPWLLSEDNAGWLKMDEKSRPISLPELKTSDRKEGKQDVANVARRAQ